MPQAKTKFVCKCKSNYGAKGEVIALELDPSKLTKRQAVMLAPYKEPVVKGEEQDPKLEALMKRTKDELEGILVEAEVEYPEKATKAELAKIILENVDVETE